MGVYIYIHIYTYMEPETSIHKSLFQLDDLESLDEKGLWKSPFPSILKNWLFTAGCFGSISHSQC